MLKNKKFSLIIIGALALTLALGLVAFAPVDTASATELAGPGGPRGGRHGFDSEDTYLAEALGITAEELQAAHEEARSNFEGPGSETNMNTLLAEALGITVEELETARDAAKEAAIEQALADGEITEEQVAMMEARSALKDYMDKDEILASVLGISVEELEAAKADGQHTSDLLEELGIDQETFQADMQAAREAALQQAVEDGVITQEQADQMQEQGFDRPDNRGGRRGGSPKGRGDSSTRPEQNDNNG